MSGQIRAKEINVVVRYGAGLREHNNLQDVMKDEVIYSWLALIQDGKIKIDRNEEEITTTEQLKTIFKWVGVENIKDEDENDIAFKIGEVDYLIFNNYYKITQLTDDS